MAVIYIKYDLRQLENYIQSISPMFSEKAKLIAEKFELIEIKTYTIVLAENKTPKATSYF